MKKRHDVIVVGSGPVGMTIARRLAEQDDRGRMRAMEADVQRLADILRRWRRGCEATWLPHGNAHLAGNCRMDRPGGEGVTNSAERFMVSKISI